MNEKTLHNSTISGARQNVKDIKVVGDGDLFKLLCKASSEAEGWMKSTKAMPVCGGCLVQVTTQQRNIDGTYAVAEALTYVPGVQIAADIDGGRKLVSMASLAVQKAPSKTTLADGSPVTMDHRELKPNGQQKDYVVLSEEERAKGFVRPVRREYEHGKCGAVTKISQAIAETFAREPAFYSGTFCSACGTHFPLEEFHWRGTDKVLGS